MIPVASTVTAQIDAGMIINGMLKITSAPVELVGVFV
jgi:hypothetical protein